MIGLLLWGDLHGVEDHLHTAADLALYRTIEVDLWAALRAT